ncbi:MAG: CotH kinase family protein, partial [Oscillospiraceae bacterium]|nr:CotH kinase family protein [Oscillospiraceae bacterium]
LVLNNMLGDATYMKEYLTFDMMKELGVTVPYFSYSEITVNGENHGFYFALEAYGDSFKQRISGDESGMLYNVKSMEMGGGMGGSSSGGTLEYNGDDASSYQAIFGNVVGAEGSDEDYARVITALKALNDGENIEKYFDVDEILRYLAVHTFVVNLDSYSSNMAQNYYIYEYDGVIKILPWDYNFAWGAFESGNASSTVNFPIDTPVSGVEMSARPLISKLFENEDYLALYHGYLRELTEKYFSVDEFSRRVNDIDGIIGGYVGKDTTAFYTYDEYKAALETFITVGNLRAESVIGQLDGTVPSTTAEQKASPDKLIAANDISLSVMGTNGFGGGMHGGFHDIRNGNSDIHDFGNMQQDFPSDNFGGFGGNPPEMPDGEFGGNMPPNMQNRYNNDEINGNTQPNMPNESNGKNSEISENASPNIPDGDIENSENNNRDTNGRGGFGNRPDRGGDRMGNMNGVPQQSDGTSEKTGIAVTAGSLIALVIATIAVWLVRSKF